VSEFRDGVLEVLSMINDSIRRVEAKLDQVQVVVVETADDVTTLRSRMIEQASRDGEERQRQQRAVQEIESRLRQLEAAARD